MRDPEGEPVLVGAAAVAVTPEPGCHLAGFGRGRVAATVLDPLWARAMALRVGRQTVALVALDCLGLQRPDADEIARRVGLRPGHLLVCATHTHSGPDTIGLWGPDALTSGVQPAVLECLLAGAAAAVRQALERARPALVTFCRVMAPPRTAVNVRDPEAIDSEISVLHAGDAETGQAVVTLVNWACHPEVLQNRSLAISSDFPDALRRRLEDSLDGTAIFVNGALGAMVTAAAADESQAEAERIGTAVADEVVAGLRAAEEIVETGRLAVAVRDVALPIDSPHLREAMARGLVRGAAPEQGPHLTRVAAWSLGPATLLAVPGEAQPALGRRWKRMMGRRHRFLLGVTNDEIGYILRSDDYESPRYAYEQTMSLGPATAGLLSDAIQGVLAAVDG